MDTKRKEFIRQMAGIYPAEIAALAYDMAKEAVHADYRNAWLAVEEARGRAEEAVRRTGYTSVEALVAAWEERERFLGGIIDALDGKVNAEPS